MKYLKEFLCALMFLTSIPVSNLSSEDENNWNRITPYFVLVSYVIGFSLCAFAFFLKFFHLPVLLSSVLIVLLWVVVTGGLHLDGVMDTFDGIFCQSAERKYEAMKDSRIGAFGAIAGFFAILLKVILIKTIIKEELFIVILISVSIARLMAVYCISYIPLSPASGSSSSLIASNIKKPKDFIVNIVSFIVLIIIGSCMYLSYYEWTKSFFYLSFGVASFFFNLIWVKWLAKHFNGHSGDTYGAVIELSEVTVLLFGVVLRAYF